VNIKSNVKAGHHAGRLKSWIGIRRKGGDTMNIKSNVKAGGYVLGS